MWILLGIISAIFLGFYETAKKRALLHNQVLGVLWSTIAISVLFFLPVILAALFQWHWFEGTVFDISRGTAVAHGLVMLKSAIVLASWICGFFALKHLPLTIAAPIDALRPVAVLLGALVIFQEKLNIYQWSGILVLMGALYLLNQNTRQEGMPIHKNKWAWLMGCCTLLAAISGLYDKFLMQRIDSVFVQSWFNVYQLVLMSVIMGILYRTQYKPTTVFYWNWAIVGVSICLSVADFAYFYALREPHALISVLSMLRRGSVVVAFACGVCFLHEQNWRHKLKAMVIIITGLLFLWGGSK